MATALLPEMLAYGSIKMVAHSILSCWQPALSHFYFIRCSIL